MKNYTALEVTEALHSAVNELHKVKCEAAKTEIRDDLSAQIILSKIREMELGEFYVHMIQLFSKIFGHRETEDR